MRNEKTFVRNSKEVFIILLKEIRSVNMSEFYHMTILLILNTNDLIIPAGIF